MNSDACRSGVAPSLPAQAALSCLPESALSAASKAARSRFEVAPDPQTAKRRETSAEAMPPSGAQRARFADGRWHFQHGPIDCIIGADGDPNAIGIAVERAWVRFGSVLDQLMAELPLLRTDLASAAGAEITPHGSIARRMVAACRVHTIGGRFITAMAAVAGSVAEELIGFFDDPKIDRAYINNGGDIALHLAPGASFRVGLVANPERALRGAAPDGRFVVDASSGVRGIATSGWRGRSFSLGIADSVTVLAATAAAADAAATVIANAVDANDPRIVRAPANEVRDDSDLGARLVTRAVPMLPCEVVERALAAGVAEAEAQLDAGRVIAAALCLQGQRRTCGIPSAVSACATGANPHAQWRTRERASAFGTLAESSNRDSRLRLFSTASTRI